MSANGNSRGFNILPTADDLTGNRDPLLKKNKVEGSYKDKNEYLDTIIRLLREDFLDPWRQTLHEVRNRHQMRRDCEVEVFEVQFVREPLLRKRSRRDFSDRLQIKFERNSLKKLRRSESNGFQHGSLVCLSADRFETLVIATITGNQEVKDGILSLSVESTKWVKDRVYELIENTQVCFATYQHFLTVLYEMQKTDTLPFQRYLLDPEQQVILAPKYLLRPTNVHFNFSSMIEHEKIAQYQIPLRETTPVLNLDSWPGPDELDLDLSQYSALKAAVTQEIAVIQGPPGTGKTFIGLKIVQLLLENNGGFGEPSMSNYDCQSDNILFTGPIILLSHTNHALDQFLEAIIERYPEQTYDENRSIFRIGGRSRSTNENLQNCILRVDTSESERTNNYKKLKSAKILAMTTSGAAKHNALINALQPKVVIVEEAGEILESHLVASLPKTCEHLILIGDHKQLRPRPASYWLETEYDLGVSLFERLVRNNLHSVCLTTQRRMRPEIAELMTPHFYETLQNHETVYDYGDVAGIYGNLLFINHNEKEDVKDNSRSYSNDHEATFLVKLCEYLVGVGYEPSQITILVTYASQERKISRYLLEMKSSPVQVKTVDNYQGEENEIILLSLVRSNEGHGIGFLKTPNRVCVALSRARIGLYIIGNGDLLRSASDRWRNILESLENKNKLVNCIKLECHKHSGNVSCVESARHFESVSKTGCSEPCGSKLPLCQHRCNRKCHQLDPDHSQYRCEEICMKMCPNDLHPCKKRCYEQCLWEEQVEEIYPDCNNTAIVPCSSKGQVNPIEDNSVKDEIDRRCPLCYPANDALLMNLHSSSADDKDNARSDEDETTLPHPAEDRTMRENSSNDKVANKRTRQLFTTQSMDSSSAAITGSKRHSHLPTSSQTDQQKKKNTGRDRSESHSGKIPKVNEIIHDASYRTSNKMMVREENAIKRRGDKDSERHRTGRSVIESSRRSQDYSRNEQFRNQRDNSQNKYHGKPEATKRSNREKDFDWLPDKKRIRTY